MTSAFAADAAKQAQWRVFIEELELAPAALDAVIADLQALLMLHAERARAMAHRGEAPCHPMGSQWLKVRKNFADRVESHMWGHGIGMS